MTAGKRKGQPKQTIYCAMPDDLVQTWYAVGGGRWLESAMRAIKADPGANPWSPTMTRHEMVIASLPGDRMSVSKALGIAPSSAGGMLSRLEDQKLIHIASTVINGGRPRNIYAPGPPPENAEPRERRYVRKEQPMSRPVEPKEVVRDPLFAMYGKGFTDER